MKIIFTGIKYLLLTLMILFTLGRPARADDYAFCDDLVKKMNESYARLDSYSVHFIKQERINGELNTEDTDLLFAKPFRVKMSWRSGLKRVVVAIYQEGENNNRIRVKTGLGFSYSTDPLGASAMKNNHHPITASGLGKVIELITANYERARKNNELKIVDYRDTQFQGQATSRLEVLLPSEKNKGYYCRRMILFAGRDSHLPVNIQIFNDNDELYENYTFLELKENVKIDDRSFQ
jgi:outer membrane lipoprotein-sorting protein